MIRFLHILLSTLILLSACQTPNINEQNDEKYLIVLSMDGFRWDYPDRAKTPNLDYIALHGVRGKVQPSFPTKTFPNHYTMATGLYPDHHGIVANEFWDDSLKQFYRISDRKSVKNPAFYQGEPIWVSAEKQGVKSATLFWVGSETPIEGIYASYWKNYRHNMPFKDRIDTVIAWLQLPANKRPHLIMWYLHEPDASGHHTGPQSKQTLKKIEYLDSLIGVFLQKLQNTKVASKVDFVITSDHGMGSISPGKSIFLEDYIDSNDVAIITGANPVYNIKVKKGKLEKVYQKLQIPHLKCWKSGSLPKRLHYGNNPRDLDLVLVADSAWSIYKNRESQISARGTHGYDNANSDMFAIFYAIGPSFKQNYQQELFSNTDLYSLFAHILNIKLAKTDGDFSKVKEMLKN